MNRLRVVGVIGAVALAIGLVPSGSTVAEIRRAMQPPPQVCDEPTRSVSLFAERISKKRVGYGLAPGQPTIPGPTLEMTEGECMAVNLVNNADVALSMHAHGVAYTVESDGTPLNDGCVPPGRSRTFMFEAHAPTTRGDGSIDPGNAGYWHYHDHCVGTDHGTVGVASGLFGALIVRRAGDPLPDREPFVAVMGPGARINLRKDPKTPTFEANQGERVEFVIIGHGGPFHTWHLHGHRWADNRTGTVSSLDSDVRLIDNKTVGPADSFGFQIIAGETVGPGAWMYHCHVQGHSDAGMSGIFVVRTAGGELTPQTRAALRYHRNHLARGSHDAHR